MGDGAEDRLNWEMGRAGVPGYGRRPRRAEPRVTGSVEPDEDGEGFTIELKEDR